MIESDVRDDRLLYKTASNGDPEVWRVVQRAVQAAGQDLLEKVHTYGSRGVIEWCPPFLKGVIYSRKK